jgi:hypothetical protein
MNGGAGAMERIIRGDRPIPSEKEVVPWVSGPQHFFHGPHRSLGNRDPAIAGLLTPDGQNRDEGRKESETPGPFPDGSRLVLINTTMWYKNQMIFWGGNPREPSRRVPRA